MKQSKRAQKFKQRYAKRKGMWSAKERNCFDELIRNYRVMARLFRSKPI